MKTNEYFLQWLETQPGGLAHIAATRDEFSYSDYVEYCDGNGIEPEAEDSSAFHAWCEDQAAIDFQEDLDQLMASPYVQRPILITGTIGCWDGRLHIVPEIEDSFEKAYRRCLDGSDDVTLRYNRRGIHMEGTHHDGMNIFMMYLVSDRDALEEMLDGGAFDADAAFEKGVLEEITDFLL